jgi:hypothetical protein
VPVFPHLRNRGLSKQMRQRFTSPGVYAALLLAQTAAVLLLPWIVFAIVHELVTNLGQPPQDLAFSDQVSIALAAAYFMAVTGYGFRWFALRLHAKAAC